MDVPSVARLAVVALALAAGTAACSSEKASSAATPAALSFEPSPASRTELGVTVWSVTSTGSYATTVQGLASDGTVAAQLDSSLFADASGARHVTLHYTQGAESATVDVAAASDGTGTLQLDSSEAAGAAPIPLGLQLLAADVAVATPFTADSTALPSTVKPASPLVQDAGPVVTADSCPLVQQCSALGQTLSCAQSAYSLTDCSIKGLVQPLEKGIQLVVGLFGAAKTVTKLTMCPTSINNFFDTCLASNPNGSTKTFGNSACEDQQSCTTASCTTSTPACVDSPPKNDEVCAPNGTYCQPADPPLQPGNADLCCSGRCGMATEYGSVCY